MNIFQDRFTTGQMVVATGVPNNTLQSWLKRDLLVGTAKSPIEGGGVPGSHRRFSFFSVMEVGVAKGLIDIGLSVSDSIGAAKRFAHVGGGPLPGFQPQRLPSLPYDDREGGCFTLLCVRADRSLVTMWNGKSDFWPAARHQLGEGFVVLEIDPIFERVTGSLGYDYRDVLKMAYGD